MIHFPIGLNMFEQAKVVARIPARRRLHPSFMHSFGITENYFVIIEQPLSISMLSMAKGIILRKPIANALKWFSNDCTLFHVVSRSTGKIEFTYKAATFFFFHVIAAFESENNIVIDICCFRDPSIIDCLYVEAMEKMHKIENYADLIQSRPLRFVLPLNVQKTSKIPKCNIWSKLKRMLRKGSEEKCFLQTPHIANLFDQKPITAEPIRENIIHLEGSNAQGYYLEDESVFCVPEILCELGCETPRINEKMCTGKFKVARLFTS